VAAQGVINLLSAYLSHPPERLYTLRRLVPTDVIDTSRTFTLLTGLLLLLTAWGLRSGKRRAFVAALFLCAVSVPVNLLKAFDFEEATAASTLMFLLAVSSESFRVKSREITVRTLRSTALLALIGFAAYAIVGCWIVALKFGQAPLSITDAAREALYRVTGIGYETLELRHHFGPHIRHIPLWFLGSLPLMAGTLLIGIVIAALQPVTHRGRHRAEAGRVAELLHSYGDNTVSFFALADDTDYFFSPNGRAVIAYRFESNTLLVIGDPIGPEEELPSLLHSFALFCREHDWAFAFFQVRPERLPLYESLGWRALHIGEDPVIFPDRFTLEGSAMGDVRRSTRKLEEAGWEARHFLPGVNAIDASGSDEVMEQLRQISAEWMRSRHGEEKGFCMGRFQPERLHESWVSVAWNRAERKAAGFLSWVPVWGRNGWGLDLMRRRADAPNGVMEFLIAKSVEAARARGDHMLSLSLSALAKVEQEREAPERVRSFLMEHLARFYDFGSLFQWKRKFAPSFEDRYLVYPDALALPRVVLALARAQSPGGLRSYFRRAA
jgi:phosphatidylglycerol lysyltransferase